MESPPPPAADEISFWSLYSTADRLDVVLMIMGTGGALASGAAQPIFAWLMGQFTNAIGGSTEDFVNTVNMLALAFVWTAIGIMFMSFLQIGCWMWTGHRQTARIRQRYLRSVLRQDVQFFDTQSSTGGLLQSLNDDTAALQEAMSERMGGFIKSIATFVGSFIVAFYAAWDVTLVMVGCLPFVAFAVVGGMSLVASLDKRLMAKYSEANDISQQAIIQVRTVATYGQAEKSVEEYKEKMQASTIMQIRTSFLNGLALGGINSVLCCSYAAAFYYGAYAVADYGRSGGDVVTSIFAALIGGFALGMAGPNVQFFTKGKQSGARLFSIINRVPTIDVDATGGAIPSTITGGLELVGVTFAYPAQPERSVLINLSLVIPAGKKVALVGGSGSGKSTVVQLLERFYDPAQGTLLLDGVDIRSLDLNWFRSQIGLVSQEPTLFATSILENIAMAKPGATREEVESAAKKANAHEFIMKTQQGYDTYVGERGSQMSGGQKQRIAIARAILKNSKILLLDEATSALDTKSERVVQAALDNIVGGRTTIVVAHRLSTIRDSDVIAVMMLGELVEQGTHDTLLAKNGAYAALVHLQQVAGTASDNLDLVSGDTRKDDDEPIVAEGSVVLNVTSADGSHVMPAGSRAVGSSVVGGSVRGSGMLRSTSSVRYRGLARTSASRAYSAAANAMPVASLLSIRDQGLSTIGMQAQIAEGAEGAADEKTAEKIGLMQLMPYNKPEMLYALTGSLGAMVVGGMQPAMAIIFSTVITLYYIPDEAQMKSQASFWSWMFLVLAIGSLAASVLMHWSFGTMGARLAERLRVLLFKSILSQEIGWFDFQENNSGVLASILSTDCSYVRGAVGDVFGIMAQYSAALILGLILALIYDWRMALLVTATMPILILGGIMYQAMIFGKGKGDKDKANGIATECITSIRVIQSYNLQKYMDDWYSRLLAEAVDAGFRDSVVSGFWLSYSQLALYGVMALVVWFSGNEISNNRCEFDGVLKSQLTIIFAVTGVAQAQMDFPYVSKAATAVQRIFPILRRKPEVDANEGEPRASPLQGRITLKNVFFAYPTRPKALVFRDFCLDMPAGKMTALVGESGSGKSTVIGLALRFYEPLKGVVCLDDVELNTMQLKWVRSQFAIVQQEPLLFHTSVLENIRYSRPDATMEEVEAAAVAANAHQFISELPQGYDTYIGPKGIQLSGGQKQRVAIARAVLRNPAVMLLDEATSALDAQSERVVQDALDRILENRTSVVVAHKLSTVQNASQIAVVHNGKVVELGSHKVLLGLKNGAYARLATAQAGSGH